jgi:hypothetical protein
MQSLELPAVTNARASSDYHAGGDQWSALGVTGIFAWAVGIAPTKDNFWSTDVQTDSSYSDHATISEPYNRLQSAVSTLSKGPVAPSDKIGRSDVPLIMKSVAADGRLLQGDKPAMMIQAQHNARAQLPGTESSPLNDGEVWSTTTTLSGMVWATTLAARLTSAFTLDLEKDCGLRGKYASYRANSTATLVATNTITLPPMRSDWDFDVISSAPLLPNGWALLGEPSKWVAVSAARFRDVAYTAAGGASVTAMGPEGEHVDVAWLDPRGKRTVVSCVVPRGDSISVRISAAGVGACVEL